ncbi:MAG: hypothetical protein ACTHK1_07060 [Actinomycetales bacterium]
MNTARCAAVALGVAVAGTLVAAPAMADGNYPPKNDGAAVVVIPGVVYPGANKTGISPRAEVQSGTVVAYDCGATTGSIAASGNGRTGSATGLQLTETKLPVRYTKPGSYTVSVCGGASLAVTVKAAGKNLGGGGAANASGGGASTSGGGDGVTASSVSGADLARTGGSGLGAVWMGGGLVALGAGFVVATTRRKQRA